MPTIHMDGAAYECAPGESVLECLNRNGVDVPSSCRAGACQTCMLQATEGAPPANAQVGLPATLAAQGYFLSCVARLEADLCVSRDGAAHREHRATIQGIERLNDRVVRVRCAPEQPLEYRPGQFMNLVGPLGDVRSYSLASVPGEAFLEFHVALMPGGRVSGWFHDTAQAGDLLPMLGPAGACFYTPGQPEQPLLLAGTGTGLAPLYGILREALQQGHAGPIHLFQGSVDPSGFYLVDELAAIAEAHPNVTYYRCVLQDGAANGIAEIALDRYVDETLPDLTGYRVFLCGHPDLVRAMQRKAFLAGANMDNIHADAFLPAAAV